MPIIVVVLFLIMSVLFGIEFLQGEGRDAELPERLVPSEKRVSADPKDGNISESIRILNSGPSDLVLGTPRSTCGCTVASVSAKVVPSGRFATVNLTATPPHAGEKTVEVRIPTYPSKPGASEGELVFRLILVGTSSSPFMTFNSGVVQLGSVSPEALRASVIVETCEPPVAAPWIDRVLSIVSGMRVDGGVESQVELSGGVVSRRYRLEVDFDRPAAPGAIDGELQFKHSGSTDLLVLS